MPEARRERRILGRILAPEDLFVIAGPCVLEGEAMALEIAWALKEATQRHGAGFIFKASYRKDNRSDVASFTGPGDREGLEILARVRDTVGVPVLTDVHGCEEVAPAAEVCACLQVPAFLSRQTRLLQAAARASRSVNVKKGQFLAPDDMRRVVEKLRAASREVEVWLTERGTTFGYHNLVVDLRGIALMRSLPAAVIYDVTHSLQHPGTGGDRRFALPLARAALAAGADGLFFETHPDPPRALSDPATQIPLSGVDAFVREMSQWKRFAAGWIDRADPLALEGEGRPSRPGGPSNPGDPRVSPEEPR